MSEVWPAEPMLEALCRERYGRLVAMATMLLGSSAGAEDLVQDALIAVFGRRRNFASVAAAEAYTRRAIATRFLDRERKSTKERRALVRLASQQGAGGPSEPTVSTSTGAESLLVHLAPQVRACIALRFLDDMSVADTARTLGLSEGAVKRYVSDGLAALNSMLGADATPQDPLRTSVLPPRRTDV